jgi:hypothetical protein
MVRIWLFTCPKEGVLRTVILHMRNRTKVVLKEANAFLKVSRPNRVPPASARGKRRCVTAGIGDSALRFCAVKGIR